MKGFTLVELVILVAMVNVLVFLTMPAWHRHLLEVKQANTQDTTFHNTGDCLRWQDQDLMWHAHCKGVDHVQR